MHAPAFLLSLGPELRLGPTLARIFVVGLLAGGLASRLAAEEIPAGDLRRPEAHDRLMTELAASRGIEDDDDYDPDGGTGTTGHQDQDRELQESQSLFGDLEPRPVARTRPGRKNVVPQPASAPPPLSVGARTVTYHSAAGQAIQGFLVPPEQALPGRPGVVVIHEWWGLNEQVRDEARKLAAAGYMALAVDLYRGRSTDVGADAKKLMMTARGDMDGARKNLISAMRYLRAQGAGKIGSLGWCMGGMFSLQLALAAGDDLDAAVMFYGHTVTDVEALRPLRAPLLGLFGENDSGITPSVPAFRAALDQLAKPHAITIYPGAGHAFANPNNTKNHNANYARDAWEKTMSFFRTFLVEEE